MKAKLIEYCMRQVQDRIDRIREEIAHAQATANEDTKSSAGDKYETGRAMMHLQQEQSQGKLSEALKLQETLSKIPLGEGNGEVGFGSLVRTSMGTFFLGVSLGKVTMDGESYFLISTASPMGKALLGKSAGDKCSVNSRELQLLSVEG